MRHDPGLAASPPMRYILEVERGGYSPFHFPSAVDGQPPREAAAYGGTVGPAGSPIGLRMQPRSEKFFTLISKAGPNVVESAAILTKFLPFRRSGALGHFDTLYSVCYNTNMDAKTP